MKLKLFRYWAMCLIDSPINFGRLAPYIFGFAIGSKGKRVK